jgi:hypothetical protein
MRFISTWRNVENDVYIMDNTHDTTTAEEKYNVAIGSIGSKTREKP